ncbi:endonuclease/exonuclease/phosphatase family domain-containing protein 1-like [Limulus polyphemus]|uniref:Endonuclease/exonuclease/phosphatase family domain-containing protein 1-like n=1 Tax=Limulus polyphemus TaxID=6850 RepID=A0ABM1C658_LIMPO|nr:endonuclease/exonuclease/phosphatase family domain-containing protein 1-like [Limulus polyphemus]
MGQCKSAVKNEVDPDKEGKCKRLYRNKGGVLSATFHVYDNDIYWDLININTATEEELMTLQGFNRNIAHNIIEYRQAIGGFRKVEDLALVSGVGASKLEHVRSEICVSSRRGGLKGGSQASSGNISLESVAVSENNHHNFRSSPVKMINVNTANMFELMSARGVSQEVAANIILHRERKGPFHSVDDLLKVKGVNFQKLSCIRFFLTVNPPLNGDNMPLLMETPRNYRKKTKRISNHRRTLSAPCKYDIDRIRHLDERSKNLYCFLSDHCNRPIIEEKFNYSRNGKLALRIAVWNIEGLTLEKVCNPGVQEVICRTILENSLSLVAFQDVSSEAALTLLATELNNPQQKQVCNWVGERGKWSSALPKIPMRTSSCGFLFDTSHSVELQDAHLWILPEDGAGHINLPTLCVGDFKVDGMNLTIVNHHLKENSINGKVGERLTEVMECLPKHLRDEKHVIIVGDFYLPPTDPALEALTSHGFSHLVPASTVTNLKTKEQDTHFWASCEFERTFTGHWGVVHEGLNHPAIPDGWMLGGPVSWHCPLWVEMYVQKVVDDKNTQMLSDQLEVYSSEEKEKEIGHSSVVNDERKKKYSSRKSKSFMGYFQRPKLHYKSTILARSRSISGKLF